MIKKFFSSDFHLGHSKVIEMSQRPFTSVEEMNNTIAQNMLLNLKENDELYYLGDLSCNLWLVKNILSCFKNKEIQFHWITGNHDKKIIPFLKYKAY